ncbi:MAG TPA: DUF456 domain-containing protein [Acidimicrobiia bacterium]|nr:DUF456 domain-containing protein [Acidimicrobiia bacterium]
MDELGELAVGLIIVVSLFGIVVPFLPGLAMEVVAVVIWAALKGGTGPWAVAIAAIVIGGIGTFVKYSVPKRHLNEGGIPNRTLLIATAVAIVGLFAIPIVGAPIGFVLAIYVSERLRVGQAQAWPATKRSLRAVATSIGIELATGLLIAAVWFGAVLFT